MASTFRTCFEFYDRVNRDCDERVVINEGYLVEGGQQLIIRSNWNLLHIQCGHRDILSGLHCDGICGPFTHAVMERGVRRISPVSSNWPRLPAPLSYEIILCFAEQPADHKLASSFLMVSQTSEFCLENIA